MPLTNRLTHDIIMETDEAEMKPDTPAQRAGLVAESRQEATRTNGPLRARGKPCGVSMARRWPAL